MFCQDFFVKTLLRLLRKDFVEISSYMTLVVYFWCKFHENSRGWKIRWKNRWNLTSSPKIYFCLILRWNLDKVFTMKSWQSLYEEVLTKHLRWRSLDKTFTMKSWQSLYEEIHENSTGEKRGEKRGEISPLHLKYIFVWFTLIYDEISTKSLRWSLDKKVNGWSAGVRSSSWVLGKISYGLEALRIKTSFILNIFGARGRNAPGSPTTFFFINIL